MDERRLRRLLRQIALGSIPWSLAAGGVACSGSSSEQSVDAGANVTGQDGTSGADSAVGDDRVSGDAYAIDDHRQDTDSAPGDGAIGQGDAGVQSDSAAESDAPLADAPVPTDPCAPWSGFPGCGGGINYCVDPDASTQALADGGGFGAACAPFCTRGGTGCALVEVDAQQLVRCSAPCTGRRPAGLVADGGPSGSGAAAYLEEVAYLEAASVDAFGMLRDELRHHGAPRSLLRAVERAAHDEVRHARVMGVLARRHGGTCRKPRIARKRLRSLVEIAVENAVEGCVRETYGALVAAHQSLVADDRGMRATMKMIAGDEARHAALAWSVGAWFDRRLTAAERRRVADARRAAVEEVATSIEREPSSMVRRFAGLPSARAARWMVARMRATLWGC